MKSGPLGKELEKVAERSARSPFKIRLIRFPAVAEPRHADATSP